jgi:hypothetical protein
MNKIILYSAAALFLVGLAGRIFFALFFPEKFAEGASKVLFLDERKKALFPDQKKDKPMVEDQDFNSWKS